MKEFNDRISKLTMKLMSRKSNAFIVNILLNLKRNYSDVVPTAGVDGTTLYINPDWFMSCDENKQMFVLLHEAWHLPFRDPIRKASASNPEVMNQAQDHYNNLMIKHDPKNELTIPKDCLCDEKFTNWEKQEIYDYLLKHPEKQCESELSDDVGNGIGSGQNLSQDALDKLDDDIQKLVQRAAIQAKAAGGEVPNEIQKELDNLYDPKLPWHQILRKYMSSYARTDYSYARVNKSYFPHGIILPTLHSKSMGKVAIWCDQSYSVTDEDQELYLGTTQAILTKLKPSEIEYGTFTTHVTSHVTLKKPKDMSKIMNRDYGGTDLRCVFNFYETHPKPKVLILISDMESSLPSVKPNYDVIWVAVGNDNIELPFGRTIHVTR